MWSFFFLSLLLVDVYSIKNNNVTTVIDLKTHVVRIEHDIVAADVKKDYQFVVDDSIADRLAFISAFDSSRKSQKEYSVSPVTGKPNHYTITFDGINSPQIQFKVLTVFTNALEPKPAEISQADKQFVKYRGSVHFYSVYDTDDQRTDVLLPKGELLAYTKMPGATKVADTVLTYGPYQNVAPHSKKEFQVHYEDAVPFLKVSEMTRLIEISHWGNIAVEETLEIKNYGAKLKGSFSRLDFDYGVGQRHAVITFKTNLPPSAKDIYYRDEIGNISTSTVSELIDSMEVTLMPRFPLMGGWKTRYTLGYNIPAYEFLYRKGSLFSLNMRFMDHVYDNQFVEKLTVKIVLPETASDIKFVPPYPVSQSTEVMKTYLDISGRTVIVAEAKNLVTEHIKDFTLRYRFNMLLMLREPLMLIAAFTLIFFTVMVYVRLDFTIYRDEKSELRLRAQALVDKVQSLLKKRSEIFESYETILQTYKANKNSSQFSSERRKLDAAHKGVTQQLHQVQSEMADIYPDGVDKVNSVNSLDQRYRDLYNENVQLAEKLLAGKLTKQQYQTSNDEVIRKKADLSYQIESILESL